MDINREFINLLCRKPKLINLVGTHNLTLPITEK